MGTLTISGIENDERVKNISEAYKSKGWILEEVTTKSNETFETKFTKI